MENFLDLDQVNAEKPMTHISDSMNMFTPERRGSTNVESALLRQKSLPSEHSKNTYSLADGSNKNGLSSEEHNVPSGATVPDASVMKSDDLILTAEHFDSAMNVNEGGSKPSRLQNLVEFEPFFQEGYCTALDVDGRCRLAEEVTDAVDCSEKQFQRENPDDDDLLGGMFSFSEEGKFVKLLTTAAS